MRALIGKARRDLPRGDRKAPVLVSVARPQEEGAPGPDEAAAQFPRPRDCVACLLAGTRVLTRRGEVPVETLGRGQMVMSLGAQAHWRPLTHVAARHNAMPAAGADAPVLIRAGALMKGSPIRDLRVAWNQGIWLEGMVVPARLLINGRTILEEKRDAPISYHYLYLEEPALLIADGAVVESGPGGDPGPAGAPLLLGGAALETVIQRIGRRADELAEAE